MYNCTRNEVMGFAPYYLLFAPMPRLPFDINFGIPAKDKISSYHDYAEGWRKRMMEAYELASRLSQREKERVKLCITRKCVELNCSLVIEY